MPPLAPGDEEPPLGDAVGAALGDGAAEAAGVPEAPGEFDSAGAPDSIGEPEAPGEPAAAVGVATAGAKVQPAALPLAQAPRASMVIAASGRISRGCRRVPPAEGNGILMRRIVQDQDEIGGHAGSRAHRVRATVCYLRIAA